MSSLENLLTVYARSPDWTAFEQVPGVTWDDAAPVENPDAKPAYSRYRGGKLLLTGFGQADLPNGKTGPDADYVRGNEGESGVTLNGDPNQVNSIAVMKFYPKQDYQQVLQAQLGASGSVRPIAGPCPIAEGSTTHEANTQHNWFYALTLGGGTLYAEAYVDEEGGKYSPGSTTFLFYRSKPDDRIRSMQCVAL